MDTINKIKRHKYDEAIAYLIQDTFFLLFQENALAIQLYCYTHSKAQLNIKYRAITEDYGSPIFSHIPRKYHQQFSLNFLMLRTTMYENDVRGRWNKALLTIPRNAMFEFSTKYDHDLALSLTHNDFWLDNDDISIETKEEMLSW